MDPALLWLWRRPATAALIGPLAWEPPYAVGVALEKTKKKKKRKEKEIPPVIGDENSSGLVKTSGYSSN